jgi:hypothetical protein
MNTAKVVQGRVPIGVFENVLSSMTTLPTDKLPLATPDMLTLDKC